MNYKIAPIIALTLLGGCSSTPELVHYEHPAKIRVMHGTAAYLYPGSTCYGAANQEMIHAAVGGFSMLVPNKKIGMPVTEDIPWTYHEYAIPGGKPLTVKMYWSTQSNGLMQSCGPVGATFTPEIGKNYDTAMIFSKGRCWIQLRELIEESPGKASAIVKETKPAFACQ